MLNLFDNCIKKSDDTSVCDNCYKFTCRECIYKSNDGTYNFIDFIFFCKVKNFSCKKVNRKINFDEV